MQYRETLGLQLHYRFSVDALKDDDKKMAITEIAATAPS